MKARAYRILGMMTTIMTACLIVCAMATSAIAAGSPQVGGADNYGTSSPVNVLMVEGEAGDTIFVDVSRNGRVMAAKQPYTLKGAETDGTVTMDLDASSIVDGVTVRAYASRAATAPVYEGTVYPVYAKIGDALELIGTRTIANGEERAFTPQETVFVNAANYRLERDAQGEPVVQDANGTLTFSYVGYDPEQTTGGTITYVDAQGNTIATEQIGPIASGQSVTRPIPVIVKGAGGDVYRTIFFGGSVVASNPGQRDFVIKCRKLNIATGNFNNFYVAKINLVDEAGNLLASDSVSVTGPYTYTAPLSMYISKNGVSQTYRIKDASARYVKMDAATDNVTGGQKTYTVTYALQPENPASVEVTYNFIDGTQLTTNAKARSIGSETVTVTPEDPVAYPTQDAMLVNNKPYVLAGNRDMYAYSLEEGGIPEVNVYYVPDDYVAPGSYDVTVRYVNLADDSVITTKKFTATPDATSDLEIATDASFEQDGNTYIRLDGQDQPISHNYYSNARTYTVYYRNANDNLAADTVITRVRVVYRDGGTTTITTPAGEPIVDDATPLAGLADDTLTGIADGNDGALVTNDGLTPEEALEDAETPLASADELGIASIIGQWWPVMAGIAAGIVAVLVIALLVARKRRNASESGDVR